MNVAVRWILYAHQPNFSPEYYKGKKVIVVGLGNTGLDTAVSLVGTADKVYVSHRGPAAIVSPLANPMKRTLN